MLHRVYYDAVGKIVGIDTGVPIEINGQIVERPSMREDVPHIITDIANIDYREMVVDLTTMNVRSMTQAEKSDLNVPSKVLLLTARIMELQSSDWRERVAGQYPDWEAYRQKLRDITDAGEPLAMVKAWPLRPDGTDAIAHLKA